MSSYKVKVVEVDGELALDLPDELMDDVDWKVGDVLDWTYRTTGVWELSKRKVNDEQE